MTNYGTVAYNGRYWRISCEPQVRSRLKRVFPRVLQQAAAHIDLLGSPENSRELLWFLQRYPMEMEADAQARQEPLKLSDDVREFLQEGINSVMGGEDADMDYEFANQLGKLLDPLYAAPVTPAPAALPPFAEKVLAKLRRFEECASDFESGGVDIGRHWLDLLTQLGLLNRVQRSPALWEISQQGEDLLETPNCPGRAGAGGSAEFSQFLSAVMDAAGLVRHGRRSKELSEYLGAQCMKYRLATAPAQGGGYA